MKICEELKNKKICLITNSGNTYIGTVNCYIPPDENSPKGDAAVVLDTVRRNGESKNWKIQFESIDICSVEILN